jgi:proton-translocating NADH-quinone oxidoreductase chain N
VYPSSFVWSIALPLAMSPLIYMAARLAPVEHRGKVAQILGMGTLCGTWFFFYLAGKEFGENGSLTYTLGSTSLCMDGLSFLLMAVVLVLGSFVVIFSGPYMSAEANQEKYYALLVAVIGIMLGLGCACDLFNLWIWFEAMAIATYFLVAYYHEEPLSLEAGVKYLVQSAAGSVLILIGISLLLSQTGTLMIAEIQDSAVDERFLLAAGGLFMIGFGVKAALVPMHTWLPDAHSQAPSGISAMLSGVVIEAGLIAMLRSMSALAGVTSLWGALLIGFGCLNILVGNLMAYRQVQVKRLLAYSSLAHTGYMLVGIGIAAYAGGTTGAQGGFFHLINHGMMKGLAFLAAGALLYAIHLAVGEHSPLTVQNLAGGARRYPLAAFTLSLAVLALGGIPPLSGFMSKWQIIVSGFTTQNWAIILVVLFLAVMSVFSLAYYAPLVNTLYKKEPSAAMKNGKPMPKLMTLPLFVLAVIIVLVGIWPSLLNWLTVPAGAAILAAFGG